MTQEQLPKKEFEISDYEEKALSHEAFDARRKVEEGKKKLEAQKKRESAAELAKKEVQHIIDTSRNNFTRNPFGPDDYYETKALLSPAEQLIGEIEKISGSEAELKKIKNSIQTQQERLAAEKEKLGITEEDNNQQAA